MNSFKLVMCVAIGVFMANCWYDIALYFAPDGSIAKQNRMQSHCPCGASCQCEGCCCRKGE